ncbi:MAG TPA: transcriptional repressor [Chryseolinea sp.]
MKIHKEFLETMLHRRSIPVTPLRLRVLQCLFEYTEYFTVEQVARNLNKTEKVDNAHVSNILTQFNRSGLITRVEDEEMDMRRPGRKIKKYIWLHQYIRRVNQRASYVPIN